MNNLFTDLPADLSAEVIETLAATGHLRIERIISHGQASPEGFWYDQSEHEFVVLLQGAARVCFENDETRFELKPGDYLHIPAHCRHRVDWTSPHEPTIWLAVHYPRKRGQ